MLLAVDESDAIHVIVLMVVSVFVSTHDKLLLGALQANRSYRFVTFLRDVDVSHVLTAAVATVLLMPRAGRYAATLVSTNEVTSRRDVRQHILHFVLRNTARVVQVHVSTVILVNRRLPTLDLACMIVAAWCVVHVICRVVVARQVLL